MKFGPYWPYEATLFDQFGGVIIQTVHKSKSSFDMDCNVMKLRIKEGKPNRGGQIPTRVEHRVFQ